MTASGAFSGRGDEGGWVEAGSLKPGDTIFDMDGGLPSRVKSVRFENISEKVYNFEVEGNHNYFVSEDGILSHNGKKSGRCGCEFRVYSNDHGPPHGHLLGGGPEVKIGQNSKPLKGEPELTRKQRKYCRNNISMIRKLIGEVMKRHRNNN